VNTPVTHRPPSRLAVCGWDERAREALGALEATGAFTGAAVGDRLGASLVEARRATGLPCFQHVSEMVRAAEYDAILFAATRATGAQEVPTAAVVAAARGAHLLVLADGVPGAALLSAAAAATTHDVPLTLLQPATHDAGIADLRQAVAVDVPVRLDITVEAPVDAAMLLRTAVGYLAEVLEHVDGAVRASAWPHPATTTPEAALAYAVDLEAGEGRSTIRVRHAPTTFVRITADSARGAAELHVRDGGPEFRFTSSASQQGEHLRYRPDAVDHWAAEAERAAHPARREDRGRAALQGALLDAIERSAATGEPQSTSCCRRPELRPELHLVRGLGRDEAPGHQAPGHQAPGLQAPGHQDDHHDLSPRPRRTPNLRLVVS